VDVVGYVRVSTAEQADSGLGLSSQRSAIEAEAQRRGWTLTQIHEDPAASGKSMVGRPGLDAALLDVANGSASALVVAKLDRLSRSLLDFAGLMAQSQKKGWALVALDLGVDTTTPAGEFMASVLASAAQWERRIIGQRTKDALAVKRAQGVQLGRPRAMPAETAERIRQMRAEGLSLRAIAEHLNSEEVPTAHGGAKWHASTVRSVLD
jgi:DNA invertase Pin-like site-specific DNA recombinase